MPYVNKYFALKEAERLSDSDIVVWMDSDVIVLAPPSGLLLGEGVDFAACPRDRNIGTAGPDDEFHEYWVKVTKDVGLDLEDLPWVTTTADQQRIRLYWNAGVFAYRPASGFADFWHEMIEQILDRTDSSTVSKLYWTDQVALSLVAAKWGLRVQNLDGSLNYGIASHFKEHLTPDGLAAARLLHYHDSMKPQMWPWFMETVAGPLPEAHRWLATIGPLNAKTSLRSNVVRDGLRAARNVRRRIWTYKHGAGIKGS